MSDYVADVTLVEVLDDFRRQGFADEFRVDDEGGVCCAGCGHHQANEGVAIEALRRVEGASDPGDMAAVLALSCPACGRSGTTVLRFGPEAGPGDAALLAALEQEAIGPGTPGADPSRPADPP